MAIKHDYKYDPLGRVKKQLRAMFRALRCNTPKSIALVTGGEINAVNSFFEEKEDMTREDVKTLERILIFLGAELVVVPSQMLDQRPKERETTMHLPTRKRNPSEEKD